MTGGGLAPRSHVLYRFFNAECELLYVGITASAPSRWKQHAATKNWWTEVATISVENYPDRESVLAAERHAITTEYPRYNIAGNEDWIKARDQPWAEVLIANGGDAVPVYGSSEWNELPDHSRVKVAACVAAAERWRATMETAKRRVGSLTQASLLSRGEPMALAELADAIDDYLDLRACQLALTPGDVRP